MKTDTKSDAEAALLVPAMDAIQHVMEEVIPFNRLLGIRVVELGQGHAVIALPFRPEFVGDVTKPAIHGGVISAVLDACGGAAVFTKVNVGDRISTIDLLVDYLRPCPLTDLIATADVVRVGGRVALVQLKAHPKDDPERLVASGRATYNIKRVPA